MTELISFDYQGQGVTFDPNARMWNLNAMHQAAGGDPSKAPRFWLRQQQAQELLAALVARETVSQDHSFVETREGRNGGTWAHWQIAAAYAHYLRPDFYLQWNEWAMERVTGQGLDAARLAGIEARLEALEGQGRARKAPRATQAGLAVPTLRQAEVIAALRELDGQGRRRQIADALGLPRAGRSALDMCLARMVRAGLLRRAWYGVYELAQEEGQAG